ncbi:MAG: PD-(D/E)XK nuclease family protein [Sphaerochaeta sp.]
MLEQSIGSVDFIALMKLLEEIDLMQSSRFKSTAGTMNLFEVSGLSHYENQHSHILAYLMDGNTDHAHPEFGLLFLEMINQHLAANPLPIEKIISVRREEAFLNGRRIDILVETSSCVVIVENKVYAGDQKNQLSDYFQSTKKEYKRKRVILCYLTLDGSDPSTFSIQKKELEKLKDQGSYVSLSYSTDILNWIKSLHVRIDEHVLKSALLQYTDLLEGLCGLRKENYMDLKSVIKSMSDMCEDIDSSRLQEVLQNTKLIEKGCQFFIFTKFLQDLEKKIKEKYELAPSSPRIFYTYKQNRYRPANIEKWKSDCMNDFEQIGIELELEELAGVGFELENLLTKPNMCFGIMFHGTKNETSYGLSKDWESGKPSERYKIVKENSELWGEYIKVNWIAENLFTIGNKKPEVDKITNWFVGEWESNQAKAPKLKHPSIDSR